MGESTVYQCSRYNRVSKLQNMSTTGKYCVLTGFTLLAVVIAYLPGRIPQNSGYHTFILTMSEKKFSN
jgi:hypothetical protein